MPAVALHRRMWRMESYQPQSLMELSDGTIPTPLTLWDLCPLNDSFPTLDAIDMIKMQISIYRG